MVQKMIMAGISSLPSKVIVGDNEKEKSPASETTSSGVINKKTSGPASTKLTKNPSTVRCKVCRYLTALVAFITMLTHSCGFSFKLYIQLSFFRHFYELCSILNLSFMTNAAKVINTLK